MEQEGPSDSIPKTPPPATLDFSGALVPVPAPALAKHYENAYTKKSQDIVSWKVIDDFYELHKQMCTGTSYLLHEKFYDMKVLSYNAPVTVLKKWFQSNIQLDLGQKKIASKDELFIWMTAFCLYVKDWTPEDCTLTGPTKIAKVNVPIPLLINLIYNALAPYDGLITPEIEADPLCMLPFPAFPGDISTSITQQDAHSGPITTTPGALQRKPGHIPAKEEVTTDVHTTQPTHSTGIATHSVAITTPDQGYKVLLDAITGLQVTMASQAKSLADQHEQLKHLQDRSSSHISHPLPQQEKVAVDNSGTLTTAGSSNGQDMPWDLRLAEVLTTLVRQDKDTDKAHISDSWEEIILPYVTCAHVIQSHGHTMNTYGQRACVNSAKSLMSCWETFWTEETNSSPANRPKKFPQESRYYSMALLASETLKNGMASHAFPRGDKPQLKERRQVLAAVMGKDITAAELKEAYSQEDWRGKQGKGKGKGTWSQNNNNSNGGGYGDNKKQRKKNKKQRQKQNRQNNADQGQSSDPQ